MSPLYMGWAFIFYFVMANTLYCTHLSLLHMATPHPEILLFAAMVAVELFQNAARWWITSH